MASTIEDLHLAVFGYVPDKPGTAYERLAAVVLTVLGWEDVRHDVLEQPTGRRAEHQLDVVVRGPSGAPGRLVVECKDWDNTVGKQTMDTLVGVRAQVGAQAAAVMTTKGFTDGARRVAVDEDIALLLLRSFDAGTDEGTYIRRIETTIRMYVPHFSDFDVEIAADHGLPLGEPFRIALSAADHLSYEDGSPAEVIFDVMRSHAAPMNEGVYRRCAQFDEARLIPTVEGQLVAIRALTWTETVTQGTTTTITEAEGEPMLVVQQLDDRGSVDSGRILVDRDLYAWEIDSDGRVRARGRLDEPGQ